MMRVGERGEGKFKRVTWDEALDHVATKMIEIKNKYGPKALLDQSYAGASYGVLHKSDQIEGLLGRFLGMFGCRTNSWSVPSYQGTTTSSRWTFGTIEDGNEDDTFAHSKLIIMWGWNPAYTFHGGNTFYYMRMAKQRGCKFVLIDPQYTDSAAAYDAWWIPIRPNTDAAMMAGMAHYIFANNLHDQDFIDRFMPGDGCRHHAGLGANTNGKENFKDYILGTYDGQPKTPEWAAEICGVSAEDIKKLADMYATHQACGAEGLLGAGSQRLWRTIQPHGRGAAGDDRQYRNPRRLRRRCWQGLACGGGGLSLRSSTPISGLPSIKSDRWAHIVLNYPNVKREETGLWPRDDQSDGVDPQYQAASSGKVPTGSTSSPTSTRNSQAIKKLELVVCLDSTITPSGLWADVLLPVATHFERHDVALPWYKGHYYIHRPKVIEPLGEIARPIFRSLLNWPIVSAS